MMAQGPDPALPHPKDSKPRPMGSRRIFSPIFKLQVLDSYRHDHDCKGNQRATARKFNIHRRQIQKWLQCEDSLRTAVAESMRQDGENSGVRHVGLVDNSLAPERRAPRVFKHDARTLKLVAQKLYPSSYGVITNDCAPVPIDLKGEVRKTTPDYFVPKEYQLNDTLSEASGVRSAEEAMAYRKPNIDSRERILNLKDDVSGLKLCVSQPDSKSLIQKYSGGSGQKLSNCMEPSGLGVAPAPAVSRMSGGLMFPSPHPPVFTPSHPLPPLHLRCRFSPPLPTSLPSIHPVAVYTPQHRQPLEEPFNLVKPPTQPEEPSHRPATMPSESVTESRGGSPIQTHTTAATSPSLRVAEIVTESKSSAFSPKRKWLQDSIQDKLVSEAEPVLPPKQRVKLSPTLDEPKPKRPCPDFSIERLCGSPVTKIKLESSTPPSQPSSPKIYSSPYLSPIVFPPPPPPILPHRTIPELLSLHFKPETACPVSPLSLVKQESDLPGSPESEIKEESISGDEETIDILSTTPVENKTFDFNGVPVGKRRSFSVQFKLNVLDAFHNDKDCNKNQRATARKFNINRRQVQKWLSLEPELRNESCRKQQDGHGVGAEIDLCAQCPQHCGSQHGLAVSVKPCMEQNCIISDLKAEGAHTLPFLHGWPHPSALPMPAMHHFMPWYNHYDYPKIY